MEYEKLSKNALKCMYAASLMTGVLLLGIVAAVNYFWLFPQELWIGKIISMVFVCLIFLDMAVSPYFRYHRYRYRMNDDCIDIKEGYVFVKQKIVPIERLHKLQIEQGPMDQFFHVSKVVVTTAGGDVEIQFLEKEKAEKIAENLKNRINEIVAERKEQDGGKGN